MKGHTMDVQSALSVADHFARIVRCAERFGYSRERLIEELVAASQNYNRVAEYIEQQMEKEAA